MFEEPDHIENNDSNPFLRKAPMNRINGINPNGPDLPPGHNPKGLPPCRTCRFWEPTQENPGEGVCHGNPPTPMVVIEQNLVGQQRQTMKSFFSTTGPEDYCGNHRSVLVLGPPEEGDDDEDDEA